MAPLKSSCMLPIECLTHTLEGVTGKFLAMELRDESWRGEKLRQSVITLLIFAQIIKQQIFVYITS